jgi:branched-chain amino acid transport system substrate-binding protein
VAKQTVNISGSVPGRHLGGCAMRGRNSVRVATAICAVLIAAACGQKPGVVSDQTLISADGVEGVLDAEGNLVDPETGEVLATAEELADTEGGSSTSNTTSGDQDTNGSDTAPGEDPEAPEEERPPGGTATGVTATTIKIGAHAPITGAAPVPSDSANKGARLYWEWLKRRGIKIHGRDVEIVLKNDNYNPSQAVAVCRDMVENEEVFLLSGSAGTDQIQACARYAASVGVPYLSAGVTELGLDSLDTYFAVSMTYPDQQPLLADMLKSKLGADGEKNGIVWFNTATFQDGHEAFVQAMEDEGLTLDYDRAISKTAGTSEAQAVITDLRLQGIENVNLLLSPVFFLQMLSAAGSQNYHPQWVAAGVQMTFDAVATAGCRSQALDGAKMFAPFPAWVDSDKYDPNFRKAVREIFPEEQDGDDFMWYGWSASKGLHEMLEQVGPNLTRERFMYELERSKNLFNGIGPHISFSPTDHFGASEVHVSEAKCSQDNRWHTIQSWVKDF